MNILFSVLKTDYFLSGPHIIYLNFLVCQMHDIYCPKKNLIISASDKKYIT